ncbi:MerR family transcriptional regulator [Arachnia propionica]|uniref:MerR family transcriptional regulator n=1 Tax=Arachnia propionica TaxID=1750 RepID=A0A3P1WYI7_9ACTN|nr:MerR family transcriptional regulator [Arachnia propionica]RRD51146.1 MerR family transcriptional regulator [Arachnia propionica]
MPSAPRTIGQVLDAIRGEFPDISVSKLRYLESEGLISPERDHPSGYRRFRQEDVDRLLFVLRAQRDRYLPLKVIREQLDALDRGEPIPEDAEPPPTAEQPPAATPAPAPRPVNQVFTRRQLMAESGLGEAAMIELERLKLVSHRKGTQVYGRESLGVAVAAKRLGDFGIDIRQLRSVQQAATMEAALVEQVLAQFRRRSGVPAEVRNDVYRTVISAHTALMLQQLMN